ncbi:unnamed protein product [Cunninghamella blakesleeana]
MKRRSFTLLPLFAVASLFLNGSEAVLQHKKFKPVDNAAISEGRYIVEFNTNAGVQSFSQDLKKTFDDNLNIVEKFNHSLFNGLSFRLDDPNPSTVTASSYDEKLQSLLDDENVKAIYPVKIIPRPKLTAAPLTNDSGSIVKSLLPHALTQVDRVHKELKNTGKGIKVGILDSGIDYNHPTLGGGFGKGYKVQFGYDLVGDDYDANDPNPIVKPGPTPLDNCGANSGASGHGTHVAGIIAGKDANFTGVAPDSTLGMWRVFGCKGSVNDDIIIKALLSAYDAGVDVINMSLGSGSAWSEGAESTVVNNLAKKGVVMVISAGNEGASGAFTVGSPGVSEQAITVASFDNTHQVVYQVDVSGALKQSIQYGSDSPDKFPTGEVVIGDNKIGSGQDACSPDTIPDTVKGKYALVQRGACALVSKAENVAKKGAIGVVIYNNAGDNPFGAVTDSGKIPALGVGAKDGLALIEAIKKGAVTLTFSGKSVIAPIPSGNTVSSFSSVGATYELDLRPTVAGVGGFIYSTLPQYLGGFGLMSGTSMSSPYVAGSVALYLKSLEKSKRPTPQFVKEQFQHYTYKAPSVNGQDNIDSPLRQGAGLIQLYDIIKQKVHITPGQISFNDTSSTKYKTHTLTLTNKGKQTVSYQIYNNASLAVNPYDRKKSGYTYTEPITYTKDTAKLRLSKKTIKVAPGKSVKVKVSVIPPKTDPKDHIMYGGYVQFKSSNPKNALDLTVPYFGVVGKQADLPIFDSDEGFPFLSDDAKGSNKYEEKDTFVLSRSKKNYAYLLTRFISATRILERELVDVKTGKVLGSALRPLEYVPRNTLSPDNLYNPYVWTGTYYPTAKTLQPVAAPQGTYQIRFRALKMFGNPKKKSDYITWTSPKIKITA